MQTSLRVLPRLAVGAYNQAARLNDSSPKIGIIAGDLLLGGCHLMHMFMDKKDKEQFEDVFYSLSRHNLIKYIDGRIGLQEVKAKFNYVDIKTKFELTIGDDYLELGFVGNNHSPLTLRTGTLAIKKVAEYIDINRRSLPQNSNFLVGITYAKFAQVSKRLGFTVAETPLPKSVIKDFTEGHNLIYPEATEKYPGVSLCFQSYDDIINRYLTPVHPNETFQGALDR